MSIIEKLFNVPKEFYDSTICQKEMRNINKIIYKLWFEVMLIMNLSVIALSLYYIIFVEGEAEIVGNYIYILLYVFHIIFSGVYIKTFCDDTLGMEEYNTRISVFTYVCIGWIFIVSILDLYYTGSYSALVGGYIEIAILYLKPKKLGYIISGATVLYCFTMIYLTLNSSRDTLGNILIDKTVIVEIVNTIFNIMVLTFVLIFFMHIKYSTKVSDIYKTAKLQELSNIDILTGLFNRMSLTHYIESINKSEYNSLIVVMMDIDNFKNINDSYGHQMGDKCIHLMGEKINEITNKGYRYGGEEFLIIFENLDENKVYNTMENFRKTIEGSNIENIKFTISIGISDRFKFINVEKIIEQADERLYEAKRTGKNKIVCR